MPAAAPLTSGWALMRGSDALIRDAIAVAGTPEGGGRSGPPSGSHGS